MTASLKADNASAPNPAAMPELSLTGLPRKVTYAFFGAEGRRTPSIRALTLSRRDSSPIRSITMSSGRPSSKSLQLSDLGRHGHVFFVLHV